MQGVYINGYQQILDTSGEPIYEVYSFIARNLAFTKQKAEEELDPVEQIVGDKGETDTFVPTVTEDEVEIVDENQTTGTIDDNTIAVNLRYVSDSNPRIKLVFTDNTVKRTVTSTRLTIADVEIGMSKSYVLKQQGID